MLSDIKLLYNLADLKESVFKHFDKTSIENCWVHGNRKTIHVKAHLGDKEFNSWGTSSNEVLAIGVSLMELVERAHLKVRPISWTNLRTGQIKDHSELLAKYPSIDSFLKTSSGLAAHLDIEKAIDGALSEIIERHVITKSVLCDLGFSQLNESTFHSAGPLGRHVIVKQHNLSDSSCLFGTAASTHLLAAIKSAKNELAPQVEWAKNPSNLMHLFETYSFNDASGIQVYNLKNSPEIKISRSAAVDADLDVSDFWYSEIEILPQFRGVKPLKVVRAFSPKLQPFYFGPLLDGPINYDAFVGAQINPSREFNIVA